MPRCSVGLVVERAKPVKALKLVARLFRAGPHGPVVERAKPVKALKRAWAQLKQLHPGTGSRESKAC